MIDYDYVLLFESRILRYEENVNEKYEFPNSEVTNLWCKLAWTGDGPIFEKVDRN